MAEQTNQEELAIRYLLGDLSEQDETALEEQIISDDEVFENLEIAEGEVIDRYVRGDLNAEESQRIRDMVANSARLAERVEIARIFVRRDPWPAPQGNDPQSSETDALKGKRSKKTPWWNLFGPTTQMAPAMRLAAASVVLLLLPSVALVFVWTRYRAESQRAAQARQQISQLQNQINERESKGTALEANLRRTEEEKARQEQQITDLQQQIEELRRQNPQTLFPIFVNPGVGTRGEGTAGQSFRIPSGSKEVELRLNVEHGHYSLYNASLQDLNRRSLVQRHRLKPVHRGTQKYVPFRVPANLLTGRTYIVHVDGVLSDGKSEDFDDYTLHITGR